MGLLIECPAIQLMVFIYLVTDLVVCSANYVCGVLPLLTASVKDFLASLRCERKCEEMVFMRKLIDFVVKWLPSYVVTHSMNSVNSANIS